MRKDRLKLELLDDYITVIKIFAYCKVNVDENGRLNNLKTACEKMIILIDNSFLQKDKPDFSFLIFKQQLNDCIENEQMQIFQDAQLLNLENVENSFEQIKSDILLKMNNLYKKTKSAYKN